MSISQKSFDYFGYDDYSFVNIANDPILNIYPFLIYSNVSSNYFIAIEPVLGFDGQTIDSDPIFLTSYFIVVNVLYGLLISIYCFISLCCKPRDHFKGKKRKLHLQLVFVISASVSLLFQLIMMGILIFGNDDLMFGFTGAYVFATILPIINLGIIVFQILLIVYILMKNENLNLFSTITNIAFIVFGILNFIFCLLVNSFGPRL